MKMQTYKRSILSLAILSLAVFTVTASAATAPANDNFANAGPITMGGNGAVIVVGNNISASKEPNEPYHADNAGGSSVWFHFTPAATKAVELRTISNDTNFDTTLAVYTGDNLQFLTPVGSNDDCYRVECGVRSRVRLLLQAGTTYRIAVDGYNNGSTTSSGSFTLILEEKIVPFEYDNMETAYDLGLINKVSIGATNHLATAQAGEPWHANGDPLAGKSVWFRFTVPSGRAMTVSLKEDFRNEIAVYESMVANPTFADLDRLDHGADHVGFNNAETSVNFLASPNRHYFVAVDWNNDVAGAQTGNFQLKIFQTKFSYRMRLDGYDDFGAMGVYRPADSTWYSLNDMSPSFPIYKKFGLVSDTPVPADYDGDAITNYAVTRNVSGSKHWYILSKNGLGYSYVQWGLSSDKEVVGDFDRDGRADPTVIRAQNGALVWYVRQSLSQAMRAFTFGLAGDRPVLGDFDGDGATEVTVVRATPNGELAWYMLKSNGNQSYTVSTVQTFGLASDLPVAEDFDGDGRSDLAVYRPSNSTWYILRSGSGQLQVTPFGSAIDVPQPGDYDGDKKADLAVYRPTTGVWYFWLSASNSQEVVAWGKPGDKPVASMATFSLPESDE
ncbi:MAG TPA: VCBS repeat-containing protein [Pyrinomonadaceae bacterium]